MVNNRQQEPIFWGSSVWRLLTTLTLFTGCLFAPNWQWLVTIACASLAVGALLGLSPAELVVLSLPFSFNFSVPETINVNLSDVVLLYILLQLVMRPRRIIALIRKFKPAKFWAYFALAFVAVLLISVIFAPTVDLKASAMSLVKLIVVLCYALISILIYFESDAAQRLKLLKAWSLTALFVSSLGILGSILQAFGISNPMQYGESRVQASFVNPNTLATYLIVSLSIQLFWIYKQPIFRALLLPAVTTIALALANSRAAHLAIIAALVSTWFLFLRNKRLLVSWTSMTAVALAIYFLTVPITTFLGNLIETLWHNAPSTTASFANSPINVPSISPDLNQSQALPPVRYSAEGDLRFSLWQAAVRLWQSSPFTGIGLGNFPQVSSEFTGVNYVTHNSFLSFLAEGGVLGFTVFAFPFIVIGWMLFRVRTAGSSILLGGIIGIVVMMSANNLENIRFIWVFMAFAGSWAWDMRSRQRLSQTRELN